MNDIMIKIILPLYSFYYNHQHDPTNTSPPLDDLI